MGVKEGSALNYTLLIISPNKNLLIISANKNLWQPHSWRGRSTCFQNSKKTNWLIETGKDNSNNYILEGTIRY